MDKREGHWRVLVVWMTGALLVLIIMLAQQVGGAFQGDSKIAWGWFTTTVVASPGLLFGAYLAPAKGKPEMIERRVYLITVAISLVYLGLVLFTFGWFAVQAERRLVDILTETALFLGPVQGLVTLALGRFIGLAGKEGR